MQSVPITTDVVSLNPAHGEVYSMIQHYVIKFVSDFTDCHDITEILLKVVLNTITLTFFLWTVYDNFSWLTLMFSFTLFIRTYIFSCVVIQRNNRHMRKLFLLLSLIPVTSSDTENILKSHITCTHSSVPFWPNYKI